MGRNSFNVKQKQKQRKGLWSPEEDEKLYNHITRFGIGCWSSVPKLAGLERGGKSCRLRWINYLRPDLKRGMFSQEEEDLIISLHQALGNRWAQIATQLPGRTDNEIKNFWNASLKKKLMKQGIDPNTHKPIAEAQTNDRGDCENGPANLLGSVRVDQQTCHFNTQPSTETSASKQVNCDPLFLSEFQAGLDFPSYFQQNPVIPVSRTDFSNFDQQITIDADYSDSSASRMSVYTINEAKDSSSNSTFSWNAEIKLESVFDFQFSGTELDEQKTSTGQENIQQVHNQISGYNSNFPLISLSQEFFQ